VSDDLLPAERKVLEVLGDRPLDFSAMGAISNLFRSAVAIRFHSSSSWPHPTLRNSHDRSAIRR
jgi:hypothetical protein